MSGMLRKRFQRMARMRGVDAAWDEIEAEMERLKEENERLRPLAAGPPERKVPQVEDCPVLDDDVPTRDTGGRLPAAQDFGAKP